MATRRGIRALLTLALVVLMGAVSVVFTGPAGAQTAGCGASSTYNPSAVFGANPVQVTQGGTVVLSGSGFAPNCELTITIEGQGLAQTITVTTDGAGGFSTSVNTTGWALGTYTATATQGSLSLTSSFTVVAQTTTTVATTLPTTGSNSTGMLAQGGLALVAVGGLLVLFARKRRGSVTA